MLSIFRQVAAENMLFRDGSNTLIPKKATREKPLTYTEKEENKVISSFRVVVEHTIYETICHPLTVLKDLKRTRMFGETSYLNLKTK